MTEYIKKENPYREGGDYHDLFAYMQRSQSFTIKGLIDFCTNKLHLSQSCAKYNVYAMNSPREKSHKGSDPRGNAAIKGHLHYSEKCEREFVAGVRQPQYYRLRWRKIPLEPKKREHAMIRDMETTLERGGITYMNRQQVVDNDNRVYDLASYYMSEGLTKYVKDMNTVQAKFMEFKRLILKGEFTLEELEADVCGKFGIVNKQE